MAKITYKASEYKEALQINEDMDKMLVANMAETMDMDIDGPADEDTDFEIEDQDEDTDFEDEVEPELTPDAYDEVAALEALDAVDDVQASEPVAVVEASNTDTDNTDVTLKSIMDKIDAEKLIETALLTAAAFDERLEFERTKGNDNITKSLLSSRAKLASPRAAAVIMACNVNLAEVNRSVHEGKRYNVYAFGKIADAVQALSGGAITNEINNAIMRSLFKFKAAGVAFTGEMAKAAASDKILVDAAIKGILVRHTVAEGTAPTQASSTMQALVTLGIVNKSGPHKNPVYTLTDSPATRALEATLLAA